LASQKNETTVADIVG